MPDLAAVTNYGPLFSTGACQDSFEFVDGDTWSGVNNVYLSNVEQFGFPNGYYNIEAIFNDVYNSFHSTVEFLCPGYDNRR